MREGDGGAGRQWTRRDAMRLSAAAGAGALLPGVLGARPASAAPVLSPSGPPGPYTFFQDPVLNDQLLFAIGSSGYGAAEFGELSTAFAAIEKLGPSADGTYYASQRQVLRPLGLALTERGDNKLRQGLTESATLNYLHASKYLTVPLYFARAAGDDGRTEPGDYRVVQRAFAKAAALAEPRWKRVLIDYPGPSKLAAYFLRPPGRRRKRPTLILNNGNDAQFVDLYVFGAAAALERGWNVLIFEGPGQGKLWFERRIPFRPDWQTVVTPLVDYLRGRNDVDRSRIAIIGWSQGGCLVARAIAHEHRLAAAVLDPGIADFIQVFNELWSGDPELLELVRQGNRAEANAQWADVESALIAGGAANKAFAINKTIAPFGGASFYDNIRAMLAYTIEPALARRIDTPTLVTEYQFDEALQAQAKPMFEMLRTKKRLAGFSVETGTQFHCAPMGPQNRNEVVLDWIERRFR